MSRSLKTCAQVESGKIVAGYSAVYPTALQNENFVEALTGGGPRSLVGILKCLVSAFCQGITSLSEIVNE